MTKTKEIMDVALPVEVASDLTIQAAKVSMETAEFLGILVLTGAYGISHPLVQAYRNRANAGVSGPKTQDEQGGTDECF